MAAERSDHDESPPPDIDVRRVLLAATSVVILLGVTFVCMMAFYNWQAPNRVFVRPRPFPSPRVFEDQKQEAERLLAAQRRRLEPSRKASVSEDSAAIAIEKAMEIIAARGANAYDPILRAKEAPEIAVSSARKKSRIQRAHALRQGRETVHPKRHSRKHRRLRSIRRH
jgi:hypothetical protein